MSNVSQVLMNPDLESVFNAVLDANGGNGKELLSLQVNRKSESCIQVPTPHA
jgi:hypothetical protein